ncbi:ComEC/Rec2 family competence protein [Tepidibacter hydrothermalis]|uniref:ComEC/Rec2 family competence protein n=1 Tax=Tepidibacter hydrothermalis TaxID=3036126 RepID=A0ABY8EAU0_9FIRM|nr:ComEC/Rec2 family competence protein [Tepidibacter hydrothermalis]WFD08719.1 ComEC/Rec2 family competence protein [Tepidibacter hydrothermalis]
MKKLNKISSILLCFLLMLFTACGSTEAKVADDKLEKTKTEMQKTEQAKIDKAEEKIANSIKEGSNNTTVNGNLKVHFIHVGQADSILIHEPSGKSMFIDAANNDDSDLVVTYLRAQGISKLDYVVGTHPHEDYIGGVDVAINTFDIENVILSKATSSTKTYKDVLLSIKNKGLKVITATGEKTFDLGNSKCEIVAPNGSDYEDLNNYSVVIKVTYGNNSFLFTGYVEDISENEMLSKGYNLKADLLKVEHHGSHSSTTPQFLKAVSPKYAIISVGKDNKYGHPAQEILSKLSSVRVHVYRTDKMGTIIATSDAKPQGYGACKKCHPPK